MTKEQLLETVLSNLLAFEKSCADTNTSRFVTEFESFFRKHENGVGLKTAIIQATGTSPLESGIVRKYLSSLSGVKLGVAGGKEVLFISVAEVSTALVSPPAESVDPPSAEGTDETSAWIVPTKFAAQYEEAVDYITNHRTWFDDIDAMNEIQRKLDWIGRIAPGRLQSAKDIVEEGVRIADIIKMAGDGNNRHDKETKRRWLDSLEKLNASEPEIEKFENEFSRGQILRNFHFKNGENDSSVSGLPPPDFDIHGRNPFFLKNLISSRQWTVLIDETGDLFDASAIEPGRTAETKRGKMVAVLVPQGSSLPRLDGGEHAADDKKDDVEERLGKLFATHPRCGILGITLEGMPKVSAAAVNYWYEALERCFDLVLRLTPLNGDGRTFFKFLVEARCDPDPVFLDSQNRMVQRTLHSSLCRLARANPSLESRIETSVSVEHKKMPVSDKDFSVWNGYVDSVANAWNGIRDVLKADLKAYGLPGRCLLNGKTQNLTATMDALDAGDPVSAEQWSELLSAQKKDGPESLSAITLKKFAVRVRTDSALWTSLVEETRAHLDSRAVHLKHLSGQVVWLEENKPRGSELPKRLELLWLVIRLGESNHRGFTSSQLESVGVRVDDLRELVLELYEEDAPLCCWAVLHLAVQKTDAFLFADAESLVRTFLEWCAPVRAVTSEEPSDRIAQLLGDPEAERSVRTAVGLENYGKLLSSLGQHAAFLGRPSESFPLFERAIGFFRKLSENGRDNETKTFAYACTALMDDPRSTPDALRQCMERYLGGPLMEKIAVLAVSDDSEFKYQHHILLRYLVSDFATRDERNAYLAHKSEWNTMEDGHPWELIEFYRAILLPEGLERIDRLRQAARIAEAEPGATLRAITAVIHGARLAAGDESASDDLKNVLQELPSLLPALGESRFAALRGQLDPATRLDPLSLARVVLPFNFR